MVTKAVIEEIVSENKVRVRIPIFNKIANAPNSTPFEELSEATICTLPGCKDNCKIGDVVYVAFEDNDAGRPVVVGYLQREYDTGTLPDIKAGVLTVEGEAILPDRTTIGNVTPENLQQLADLAQNIQANLDQLKANIQDLYNNGVGSSGNDLWQKGVNDTSIENTGSNRSRAGCFGYYFKDVSVDQNNKKFTASLVDENGNDQDLSFAEEGDTISCKADYSWSFAGTIEEISESSIIVSLTKTPPSNWKPAEHAYDADQPGYLWFPYKSTNGVIKIGEYNISQGHNNVTNELGGVSFGGNNIADGRYAFAVGRYNEAGYAAYAEGYGNKALELYSHAEGAYNTSKGNSSHAEGRNTSAIGARSHVEGGSSSIVPTSADSFNINNVVKIGDKFYIAYRDGTDDNPLPNPTEDLEGWQLVNTTTGDSSHAEGESAAIGRNAHSEGRGTLAQGLQSHAEGYHTQALHNSSHAEGSFTRSGAVKQHIQGQYNKVLGTDFVDIIGWGTSEDKRKNIFVVDKNGNLYIKGTITQNCTNANIMG